MTSVSARAAPRNTRNPRRVVHPLACAPVGLDAVVLELVTDDVEAALRELLAEATGRLREAVRRAIWLLAYFPTRLEDGVERAVELAGTAIAYGAEVSLAVAYEARHAVVDVVGALVDPEIAALHGANLRRVVHGARRAQHVLLSGSALAAVERVAAWIVRTHRIVPPNPAEWITLEEVSIRGRTEVACCPWHDDRRPSLLLHDNGDGTGHATCMRCVDNDGRRLTGFWRRTPTGIEIRRSSRSRRPSRTIPVPPKRSRTETRYYLPVVCGAVRDVNDWTDLEVPHTRSVSRTAGLVNVTHAGVNDGGWTECRHRRSTARSWLSLVRHADRQSCGPAGQRVLHSGIRDCVADPGRDQRQYLPDRYASVHAMTPIRWLEIPVQGRTIRIPVGFAPAAVSRVGIDLDGFEDAPIFHESLADIGPELDDLARGDPRLSGGLTVVRTSRLGVQVVLGLRRAYDPAKFYRDPRVVQWLDDVEREVLAVVRSAGFKGGVADQSARGAGRLFRRPGPRWSRRGPYLSRLVHWAEVTSR